MIVYTAEEVDAWRAEFDDETVIGGLFVDNWCLHYRGDETGSAALWVRGVRRAPGGYEPVISLITLCGTDTLQMARDLLKSLQAQLDDEDVLR